MVIYMHFLITNFQSMKINFSILLNILHSCSTINNFNSTTYLQIQIRQLSLPLNFEKIDNFQLCYFEYLILILVAQQFKYQFLFEYINICVFIKLLFKVNKMNQNPPPNSNFYGSNNNQENYPSLDNQQGQHNKNYDTYGQTGPNGQPQTNYSYNNESGTGPRQLWDKYGKFCIAGSAGVVGCCVLGCCLCHGHCC